VTSPNLPAVLFVATPRALGGSNRSLVTVLRRLGGRVHRVLAAPADGAFVELVEAEGLADERIVLPRRPQSPVDRLLRLAGGARIAWWAVRNRKRLAAIHANALTGLNLSTPAALLTRRPVVVWIHDPVGSRWGALLGPALRFLIPRLQLAAVSATAEAVAVENRLCRPGTAAIVPNPIDPTEIRGERTRSGAAPLHIGFVGGATRRKGFDLLPEVVAALAAEPVMWKLYVFLEPSEENAMVWEELRRFPPGLVDPVGKLADVRTVYADLDVAFIPSRAESFCRVAAEAMMNGIPVVGSDIPPLRALLGDDEAGLIFPSEDVAAAVAALRKVIGDPELRRRMGAAGLRRVAAYDPGAITDQLLGIYGVDG